MSGRQAETQTNPNPSQAKGPPAQKPANKQAKPPYMLKVERNLVLVQVVVRDHRGELVDGLKQDDFVILDNGKPQPITDFSVRRETPEASAAASPAPAVSGQPATAPPAPPRATHYIAFYFDDEHLQTRSAVEARQAAEKFLAAAWHAGDYAGVFTAMGQTTLDFTSDLSQVREAIARISARPEPTPGSDTACPHITPYQAYLIVERRDPTATTLAENESIACNCPVLDYAPTGGVPECISPAKTIAWDTAKEVWNHTRYQSQATLDGIVPLIERMASLPGERMLAFVSPGFITTPDDEQVGRLIDLALHDQVTVGTLDARGLYTISPARYGRNANGPALSQKMIMLHTQESIADDALAQLAEATGGTFFHNDNDLVAGFKQVTSVAAVEYQLGFSPNDLKPDGAYHSMKVEIAVPGKYQIQARKGYYAPTKAEETRANISDPIQAALYSNSFSQAFPVAIATSNARARHGKATVSVTIHIGFAGLDFRAKHGHHLDTLVFRTALFAPGYEYVAGDERTLPLDLDDARFIALSRTGIFAVTHLKAPSGTYTLREVVAEKETGKLSALSEPVVVR